ncbi:hypothetical protein [Amycolatopsis aidingensis]|uniref:hypothetical protein n=1 Tax=Amycolatopsis aidingensis TaxID=2842453 RepID=UPI001C0D548F|nr:hypothetical protein [Amycolatopsis aidingensis]
MGRSAPLLLAGSTPATCRATWTTETVYVNAEGEIDTEAITADLAVVLPARPHLARPNTSSSDTARRPDPDPLAEFLVRWRLGKVGRADH